MKTILPFAFGGILLLAACTGTTDTADHGNAPTKNTSTADSTTAPGPATASEAERYGADSLLSVMGPLQGKVVADMFAGDGYYTWKLLDAGARVLAIDDDPDKVAALEARKKKEGIGDDRLLVRLTPPGVPGLMPNEADIALITREFAALGDRKAWIGQLEAGVRSPHLMVLVGYVPFQTPYGSPLSQRMSYNTVSDELTSYGFGDISIFYKKMRYRYIIMAAAPPEE
jgi:hypothetical protein